jgi:hypothetical protein
MREASASRARAARRAVTAAGSGSGSNRESEELEWRGEGREVEGTELYCMGGWGGGGMPAAVGECAVISDQSLMVSQFK